MGDGEVIDGPPPPPVKKQKLSPSTDSFFGTPHPVPKLFNWAGFNCPFAPAKPHSNSRMLASGDEEFIRARKGKAKLLQDPNFISSALPSQVAMSLLDSSFNLDALVGGDVALKHAITNAFIGAVADVLPRWSFPMQAKGAGSEFARIDGAGPVSFRLGSGLGVS